MHYIVRFPKMYVVIWGQKFIFTVGEAVRSTCGNSHDDDDDDDDDDEELFQFFSLYHLLMR